jgi:hypothetical protein
MKRLALVMTRPRARIAGIVGNAVIEVKASRDFFIVLFVA